MTHLVVSHRDTEQKKAETLRKIVVATHTYGDCIIAHTKRKQQFSCTRFL